MGQVIGIGTRVVTRARVVALPVLCAAAFALALALALGAPAARAADPWTSQAAPGPSGPPNAALTGVSCVSSTFCMAVGTSDFGFDRLEINLHGPIATFAERWDGSAWTVLPTPAAAGSPGSSLCRAGR
ncbi:MAG TPA: hypothetical protein VGH67_02425 [Solirubrobacteraceae bacterium]